MEPKDHLADISTALETFSDAVSIIGYAPEYIDILVGHLAGVVLRHAVDGYAEDMTNDAIQIQANIANKVHELLLTECARINGT